MLGSIACRVTFVYMLIGVLILISLYMRTCSTALEGLNSIHALAVIIIEVTVHWDCCILIDCNISFTVQW